MPQFYKLILHSNSFQTLCCILFLVVEMATTMLPFISSRLWGRDRKNTRLLTYPTRRHVEWHLGIWDRSSRSQYFELSIPLSMVEVFFHHLWTPGLAYGWAPSCWKKELAEISRYVTFSLCSLPNMGGLWVWKLRRGTFYRTCSLTAWLLSNVILKVSVFSESLCVS